VIGKVGSIVSNLDATEEHSIRALWQAWSRYPIYSLLFVGDTTAAAPVEFVPEKDSSSTHSSSLEEEDSIPLKSSAYQIQQIAAIIVSRVHASINFGRLIGTCEVTVEEACGRGTSPFWMLRRKALSSLTVKSVRVSLLDGLMGAKLESRQLCLGMTCFANFHIFILFVCCHNFIIILLISYYIYIYIYNWK
jgi:hypothetical protein